MAVTKFRASQIANANTEDGLRSAQFNDGELTTVKLADGAEFIKRGGTVAFTADQSMGSHKLTNITDGAAAGDAVNKGQLDTKAAIAGSTSQAFSVADATLITQAASLGQVQTLLQNAGAASEWQDSCDTFAITPPGSPTTGQRCFIIASYVADTGVVTPGTPTGVFTGKAGQIAQWNGSSWVFTVATNGTYVSVDTETGGFFLYTGTWAYKSYEATQVGTGLTKTANTIALAATVAGAGLTHAAGVLAVGAGTGITVNADDIALAATVAGNGLTHTTGVLAVGAGNGITVAADTVAVNADGSTLDGTAAALKVKDAGITATQLAASVAGNGLTGGAGTALAVGGGDGITVTADAIALATTAAGAGLTYTTGVLAVGSGNGITVAADAISVNADNSTIDNTAATLKVKNGGITETQLAASVAGAGLVGGVGVALAVGSGNGITVAADAISVNADNSTIDNTAAALKVKNAGITATQLAASVAGNGLTGGAGTALAVGAGTGITVTADAVAIDTAVVQTFTNYKHRRTPTGTPNNILTVFTLPETPAAGTERIYVSGQLMEPTDDYTLSGATLTFVVAPATTDKIRGFYYV